MSRYKVDITGINTNELKVLSAQEQQELFERLRNGDLQAKEELATGNLRLVLSILKRYANQKYNLDDLFQIGCVGLMKAIDNFDPNYGVMFSTYAVPLILGEVKRYVRDNNSIRVSRSTRELAYKILKFKDEYLSIHGCEPTNGQIAIGLGVEEYDIANALDSLKEPMSIFEPIYNDGGDTIYLLDQIADKKDIAQDKDSLISMRRALKQIKERERYVLVSRYIVGITQMEIASKLKISQAQVSRIEKTAISNIKRLIK